MRDRDLYAQILGIQSPWSVTHVELDTAKQQVEVFVDAKGRKTFPCPKCGRSSARHDHRSRKWRHLDTCQFKTILTAEVPRVLCKEHGVRQAEVPWAEAGSRFTALFEAVVIEWLKEATISAVARRLGMTWDAVDGVMARAVRRGRARREPSELAGISVDETSFAKGHEYVTVVASLDETTVEHVADGRGRESLDSFYEELSPEQRASIQVVTMDMHQPFIRATKEAVPHALIAFDKFHVAKHLGDAVDSVRRNEHRQLMAEGDERLKGTRYAWLRNDRSRDRQGHREFAAIRDSSLKTARAWALKTTAMDLWGYVRDASAKSAWLRWTSWAMRSRLEPMKKVAKMVRNHLGGIVNAVVLGVTNALAESLNAKIQRVKRMACGFRSRERFRNAIYFHLGGLDLYPAKAGIGHTKA
jgi:transposase